MAANFLDEYIIKPILDQNIDIKRNDIKKNFFIEGTI